MQRDQEASLTSLKIFVFVDSLLDKISTSVTYPEPCQASKMELSAVNYFCKTLCLGCLTGF